jgi:hypothetical protein
MQVSAAQGFANIARRFQRYHALLRDAHRDRIKVFDFFAVSTCSGRAGANAMPVPERIAVTAAIAPEAFRFRWGPHLRGCCLSSA